MPGREPPQFRGDPGHDDLGSVSHDRIANPKRHYGSGSRFRPPTRGNFDLVPPPRPRQTSHPGPRMVRSHDANQTHDRRNDLPPLGKLVLFCET